MPNWKKVLTSGSVGELSSLFAPSITGSLLGTASYAVTASLPLQGIVTASSDMNHITFTKGDGSTFNILLSTGSVSSASYAVTASYVLPLRQDVIITGSLLLTSSFISQVDYIDFNTGSVTPTYKSGRVFWDDIDGCLNVYNAEADITLQVGQESWVRAVNKTNAIITNGTAVRLIGALGDVPKIVKAQSVQVSGSALGDNQILGIATHDIEDNSFGYVTTQGLVRGVNTSAFSDGDLLFVSSSAGQITNVTPIAPYEVTQVGVCVKSGPGASGIIFVFPTQPIDFGDLSSAERGVYQYGDIWSYVQSGSVGIWRHSNQLSGSYGITGSLIVSASGTTNDFQVGSNKLFVSSSGRVGIGTITPNSTLHVNSTATPSTGESIARFTVSDADGTLAITNNTTGDGLFQPALLSQQPTSSNAVAMAFRTQVGLDTGTNAATLFEARSGSAAIITTRPLFLWRNYTTDYMLMDATGSLGLGTSSPTAKLHVNNTGAGNSFLVEDSTNPDATPFVIDTNGKVGIGTTTPGEKLHIDQGRLRLDETWQITWLSTAGTQRARIFGDGGSNFIIETGASNTEKLRVTGTGLVGIGTPSPTAQLHVNNTGSTNSFLVEDSTNPDATPFIIDNSGAVGIGTTTPTTGIKLDINGGIRTQVTDGIVLLAGGETAVSGSPGGADGIRVRYENDLFGTSNDGLIFEKTDANAAIPDGGIMFANLGNDGTRVPAMSIRGTGNVGIGTTIPNARLDISGSAIITGSLTVTQGITGSLFGTASWAQNAISASFTSTASYVNPLQQNVIITGSVDVQFGNVNLRSNAYFFNGSNTTGVNVSLIGVDSNNIIRIGNQGYLNEIESATNIDGDTQITGSLSITGSTTLNGSLTTKTFRLTGSAYTASATDYRIGIRYTNTGSVSIQLPLISQAGQIEYRIKDEEGNATVNTITLVASGSNLIDGSTTAVLRRDYIAVGLYNDGVSNWYIE